MITYLPPGHDLWPGRNFEAPRMLREITGDFVIEIMVSNGDKGRRYGGLVIWKDKDNYMRLELPSIPAWDNTVCFGANVSGKFIHPGVHLYESEEAFLRLERKWDRFTGYISSDGVDWYICGWTDITMEDPIKVGVHALCPESPATSTRFEYFRIYRPEKAE